MKWTEEQKRVIETKNKDILVSAAAGSGKTAVLVERIISRVLDEKNPVDVDRFLVVTFTNAAAAQMKERIRKRIIDELDRQPGNVRFQQQASLVAAAHISTVHSFCGYVIQNYFHRIGLDPSYRQGTESELALLGQETMEKILEEEYNEEKPDFSALANLRMFNRSDDKISEMVFEIYDKAVSEPFPDEWLSRMEECLGIQTEEEWEKSALVQGMLSDVRSVLEEMREEQRELLAVCNSPGGPYYFVNQVAELGDILGALLSCRDYTSLADGFASMEFSVMRAKKDGAVLEEKKTLVSEGRNACRDELRKIKEKYFSGGLAEEFSDFVQMSAPVLALIRLARRYLEAFTAEKRDRGIVDFNDLEQLALSILLEKGENPGEHVRSAAAEELSDFFEEVMIDEYQDSNRVQDTILRSVSRSGREGCAPNLFMVGDVKQSIYRFRNACPELFSEKLSAYGHGVPGGEGNSGAAGAGACGKGAARPDENECICLHQNFRSRGTVLEAVNEVFGKVMHRDIGGVEYDEDARLVPGRVFPDAEETCGDGTGAGAEAAACGGGTGAGAEAAACGGGKSAGAVDLYVIVSEEKDLEYEAWQAVGCIRDFVGGAEPLLVAGGNGLRRASYRDIAILVRSVRTMGQPIFDVLTEAGIPAVMEQTQGFFATREISLMASMLQVVDNPGQDIPLAAVLVGPMFGFSEEELAKIRAGKRDRSLYDSLRDDPPEELFEKISYFESVLGMLREKMSYAAVTEIIRDIYRETGIYESVLVMRDGARRSANMDRLLELAREFDGTTYHGLNQFVRYINRIREQNEKMGEVNLVDDDADAVRIMTMHGSKGLEFPVCMILGTGKKLAHPGKSVLTIHQKLGIAAPVFDSEKHTKKNTSVRNYLSEKNRLEDLGEEMRLLYVAMTRAEEKLVLIGSSEEEEWKKRGAGVRDRRGINSFFDMLMTEPSASGAIQTHIIVKDELLKQKVSDIVEEKVEKAVLGNFDTEACYHSGIRKLLGKIEAAGCAEAELVPVKVSVSDLKMKSMEEMELSDFTVLSHDDVPEEMPVPEFISKKELSRARRGAAYGNVWHQVMAAIDFGKTGSEEEIKQAVGELVKEGKMEQADTELLNYQKLLRFFQSDLGIQMKEAAADGLLHREQPFVIQCPACDIFPDRTETEPVLVQGIIDGYFEKDGGIVLMDYKTDSLKEGEEHVLAERYATQMEMYSRALQEMLEMPVKAVILYSFSLGREIPVPERGDRDV